MADLGASVERRRRLIASLHHDLQSRPLASTHQNAHELEAHVAQRRFDQFRDLSDAVHTNKKVGPKPTLTSRFREFTKLYMRPSAAAFKAFRASARRKRR